MSKEILCPVCEHKLEILSEMMVTMYRCTNQDCSEKNKMSSWNILEKRRLFIQSRIDRAEEEAVRKERERFLLKEWQSIEECSSCPKEGECFVGIIKDSEECKTMFMSNKEQPNET